MAPATSKPRQGLLETAGDVSGGTWKVGGRWGVVGRAGEHIRKVDIPEEWEEKRAACKLE